MDVDKLNFFLAGSSRLACPVRCRALLFVFLSYDLLILGLFMS